MSMREEALGQGNAVGDCRHERRRWELRAVPREAEEQTRGSQRYKGHAGGKEGTKGGAETRGGHEGEDGQKGLRQPYTDGRTGAAADQ